MKKTILWMVILMLSISIISVFSLVGCKEEEAVEEEPEEAAEEVEEEEPEEAEEEPEEAEEEEAVEEAVKEPVNTIMFTDILVPAIDRMFERFTADTGWPVENEPVPGGQDFFNIVPARLEAGEGPDILMAHGTVLEYLLYNPVKHFVDMTEFTEEKLTGTLIPESLVEAHAYQGVTYGFPWGPLTLRGYYYNKNILEEAGVELPTSCIDFLENVAPKIKEAGFDPIYGMGQDAWGIGMEAENFVGDEFTTTDIQEKINNNEATFADSAFLGAFEWQKSLYDAGLYNDDVLVGTYDGAVEALVNGTAFCSMLSVNTMGRFPDEANEEYLGGFSMSENSNRAFYSLPIYAYLIKEESGGDNSEGAQAFVEWFIQEDNLLEFYSDLKTTGAYMGIDNEMWPYAKDLKAAFDTSDPPFTYSLQASTKQAGTYSSQVVAGTLTPMAACEQMQEDFAASAKAAGLEAYQ
jgi:ABC-type glycerol-3-phosphate transport system substrate-binding protein